MYFMIFFSTFYIGLIIIQPHFQYGLIIMTSTLVRCKMFQNGHLPTLIPHCDCTNQLISATLHYLCIVIHVHPKRGIGDFSDTSFNGENNHFFALEPHITSNCLLPLPKSTTSYKHLYTPQRQQRWVSSHTQFEYYAILHLPNPN